MFQIILEIRVLSVLWNYFTYSVSVIYKSCFIYYDLMFVNLPDSVWFVMLLIVFFLAQVLQQLEQEYGEHTDSSEESHDPEQNMAVSKSQLL